MHSELPPHFDLVARISQRVEASFKGLAPTLGYLSQSPISGVIGATLRMGITQKALQGVGVQAHLKGADITPEQGDKQVLIKITLDGTFKGTRGQWIEMAQAGGLQGDPAKWRVKRRKDDELQQTTDAVLDMYGAGQVIDRLVAEIQAEKIAKDTPEPLGRAPKSRI